MALGTVRLVRLLVPCGVSCCDSYEWFAVASFGEGVCGVGGVPPAFGVVAVDDEGAFAFHRVRAWWARLAMLAMSSR